MVDLMSKGKKNGCNVIGFCEFANDETFSEMCDCEFFKEGEYQKCIHVGYDDNFCHCTCENYDAIIDNAEMK